jgi:type VI secretion system protein ImpA
MSILDIERLLAPVPGDDPCGADLELDPDYMALERSAVGKPEQEFGGKVYPAEPPDWRKVRTAAESLLGRAKDLRLAAYLNRALVNTEGPEAWADSLAVAKGLVERYWDGVHPRLDPDDGDATARVNALGSLGGDDAIRALRAAPFVGSPVLGRFSLRDHEIATGRAPAPPDADPPQLATLEAIFTANPQDAIAAAEAALGSAVQDVRTIEAIVAERVGAANGVDLSNLAATLGAIHRIFEERSARLAGRELTGVVGADGERAAQRAGEIGSHEDVIRMLDKACEYFERHEPSSPVPILLRRAKRLVSKNFMEIIRDLAPDGLTQVETIRGGEGD